MTDKPTPTDAELKAMWQIHAADIGGIFHYARAVLEKWGTPATGGEPAGTVGYTVHGTQYVNWRTKPPAHGTPLYTTPQPTQPDPAYSEACNLATALFKKHFAHLPDYASGQAVWGLFDSTEGVILQIDNMVAGLVQPPTKTQPVAREPLTDEQIAEMMRDTWGCASIAPRHALEFARVVERAHGIKGANHDR